MIIVTPTATHRIDVSGRERMTNHRMGRWMTAMAVLSCFSVLLLVQQLYGETEADMERQRHRRYLLMAGQDSEGGGGDIQQQQHPVRPATRAPSAVADAVNQTTSKRLPRALIIGVRKGGTRALLEMLNLHPAIAMVPTEIHFFDKVENYQRGLEWYREQMPLSTDAQYTVEKSPSYYITPEVPERVYAMNPSIQLVLIVRDPVVRLLSDFTQIEASRTTQGLPLRRFQDVALLPNGEVNTQNRALHVSLYAKFLSRWLHVFPRRQLHIVDGDKLIKDPWPQLQRVEDFLGMDHLIRRDQLYFNATKGFYCLNDDTAAHHHKCLTGSKGRRHPHVPEEVISVLRQFFAPHNRKFFAMVGQDFDWPDE